MNNHNKIHLFSRSNPSRFERLSSDNISKQMIQQAVELDSVVYPKEYQGDFDRCCGWFHKNKDIYSMVIDNECGGKVVGYACVLPLTKSASEKVKLGTCSDLLLTPDDIAPSLMDQLSMSGRLTASALYIASIVIHPDYRCYPTIMRLLRKAIMSQLMMYFFYGCNEVLADAVSEEGEVLCRHVKLNKLIGTDHGSSVYSLCFKPGQMCSMIGI